MGRPLSIERRQFNGGVSEWIYQYLMDAGAAYKLNVIKGLAGTGITMVLVTHEMVFAREVADRICFLDEGKLVEDAPPSVFFSNPKSVRAREFLDKMM